MAGAKETVVRIVNIMGEGFISGDQGYECLSLECVNGLKIECELRS